MNIIKQLKKYKPSKKLCMLYFFIPIFLFIFSFKYQDDIYFLLNYGKYIINSGFPVIEPFTIHNNFDFIMQQWLSSVLFYGVFKISFKYGLFALCFAILIFIMFMTYKIVMLISKDNYRISTLMSILTSSLLIIFGFITPRPQIIDISFLLGIIYIMEKYKIKKDTKLIYLLPLISILQINFHSMLWLMLFIFMLPYIVEFSIYKIKDKQNNRIFKLLLITLIMLVVGLINPYGYKSIINLFTSYNNVYATELILELAPANINAMEGILLFGLFFLVNTFYLINKKRMNISQFLLFYGTFILSLMHIRSICLFITGTIPLICHSIKQAKVDKQPYDNKLYYCIIVSILCIIIGGSIVYYIDGPKSNLEKGVNYLLKNNKKEDIKIYTNFDNGSYVGYRGLKVYIDTRAEIFYKSNNHKEDIFYEFYLLHTGKLDYQTFINKYNFTHLLINKNEWLYSKTSDDTNYEIIYDDKTYSIFAKKDV